MRSSSKPADPQRSRKRCERRPRVSFAEEDERSIGREKLEFAEVRWMAISSYLKRESHNGTKPVKQIEFKGDRLDMTSVRSWRDKVLRQGSP